MRNKLKKYFEFVEQAKAAGINIPIIPGIKPFKKLSQLSMIPKTVKVDLPEDLVKEALKCKNDAEAERVGIESVSYTHLSTRSGMLPYRSLMIP